MEGVPQLQPPVQSDGVDGEVPAAQVLLQRAGELHPVRVAAVGVGPVPAVGGHLHPVSAEHRHRAVLQSGGGRVGREQLQDFVRRRVGGHVPVPRRPAQQPVPHRAPHAPGLIAR